MPSSADPGWGSVLMSMNWPVRVRRDEGGDGGVEPG